MLVDIEFLFSCSTQYLTRKLSSWTLEQKFRTYAHPCNLLYLSYKLQCYARIFSPEKSRADTSLAFRATRSCWWINKKDFTIFNPRSFVGIFSNYGCWNTEKTVSPTDSDVQTFLEGEENQYTKTKTESYVFGGFGNGISRGWERKLTNSRFATGRFCPFTWKISFVGKGKVNKREFCKLKITLNVVFVIMIQSIFFISSIGANALHDFCSGIADPFIFIH